MMIHFGDDLVPEVACFLQNASPWSFPSIVPAAAAPRVSARAWATVRRNETDGESAVFPASSAPRRGRRESFRRRPGNWCCQFVGLSRHCGYLHVANIGWEAGGHRFPRVYADTGGQGIGVLSSKMKLGQGRWHQVRGRPAQKIEWPRHRRKSPWSRTRRDHGHGEAGQHGLAEVLTVRPNHRPGPAFRRPWLYLALRQRLARGVAGAVRHLLRVESKALGRVEILAPLWLARPCTSRQDRG